MYDHVCVISLNVRNIYTNKIDSYCDFLFFKGFKGSPFMAAINGYKFEFPTCPPQVIYFLLVIAQLYSLHGFPREVRNTNF